MMEEDFYNGIVCECKGVSYERIVEEIHTGAETLQDIMERTGAGETCGRCRKKIKTIITMEKTPIL